MTSPSSHRPPGSGSPGSPIREKLSPEQIAQLRDWVEGTTRPFKHIGQKLGISASTVSRYAKDGDWKRPDGAAPPSRIALPNPEPRRRREPAPPPDADDPSDRRERITEKLWRLAERHAEELEDQPIARAGRSLQPLARLTRTLGEIDKHLSPPCPPDDDYPDLKKPKGRNIHELRDELAAHLERIEREERDYDERYRWTFENGAGI